MENDTWIEKYRPNNLNDVISQDVIIQSLKIHLNKKIIPNLIFYGPPGTGKTTTILAFARQFYTNINTMVLELNGSDDRGINIVRDEIKKFSMNSLKLNNVFENKDENTIKLVILDEADALTEDAQFALRRLIELYADTTRFCFICNYLNKIIPALQSRCILFKFKPIDNIHHYTKLKYICDIENIIIDDKNINKIIDLSDGDMRRSINLLHSIYMSLEVNSNKIEIDDIYKILGYPYKDDYNLLITIFKSNDENYIFNILNSIQDKYFITNNDIMNIYFNYIKDKYITSKINNNKINNKLIFLLDELAKIQIYLSNNSFEKIHLKTISLLIANFNL